MVWKSSFVDFFTSFGNEDRRESRTRNVTGFPGCFLMDYSIILGIIYDSPLISTTRFEIGFEN